MALPILDGNQTAATLSTIVTGGQHIPAHTVVSLGSQAITDVRSAVSGSVVSISNFPSIQTIAGTVTANAFGVDIINAVAQPIPLSDSGEAVVVDVRGGFGQANVPISGTVTANGLDFNTGDYSPIPLAPFDEAPSGGKAVVAKIIDEGGNALNFSVGVPISGTVTATLASAATAGGTLPSFINIHGGTDGSVARTMLLDSSGRTVVTVSNFPATQAVSLASTTVTVSALPSGALTTRFGSVVTANLAFITSAVTNTSRKYLLAQNISAGTVTIGIGFSPTTTQGIQLTAGGGLTFDTFCPTGAVYWLGAVTGAAFTILEG